MMLWNLESYGFAEILSIFYVIVLAGAFSFFLEFSGVSCQFKNISAVQIQSETGCSSEHLIRLSFVQATAAFGRDLCTQVATEDLVQRKDDVLASLLWTCNTEAEADPGCKGEMISSCLDLMSSFGTSQSI